MKKLNVIWCLVLIIFGFGYVQGPEEAKANDINSNKISFGLKAGLNIASTTDADFGTFVIKYKSYNGYHFGVIVDYPITSKISLRSELLYTRKGFTSPDITIRDAGNNVIGTFTPKQYFTYIEIPIKGSYKFPIHRKINLNLLAGPSIGFLSNSKQTIGLGAGGLLDPDTFEDVSDDYKSLDLSLMFGTRFDFNLSEKIIFLEGVYTLGLTGIFKKGNASFARKHKVISFSLGYVF